MKTTYNKTQWVDNSTPIDASRLNNIENGIEGLYNNALSPSNLQSGPGISIGSTEEGDIQISLTLHRLETQKPTGKGGQTGDYYFDNNNNTLYFCLSSDNWIALPAQLLRPI